MPFNPATAVFSRIWQFVDRFREGDDITREALDHAFDDLTGGIQAALNNNLNFVGDWIAGSAFPTQRPDGTPVRARDTWRVSTAGTVGGIAFDVDDYLTALVPSPGSLYANNWIKIPSLLIPSVLTLVDEVQDVRDDVSSLFTSFDARYLGEKTGDPLTDNIGAPLIDGALYWNSVLKRLRIYDLSSAQWTETSLVGDAYAQKVQNLNDLTSKPTAIANLFGTTALVDWVGRYVRVKPDATGLEFRSAAQVRGDIDVPSMAQLAAAVPAGTVVHFAAQTPPTGYLKANGAAVSRTTYAALFSAIGTAHGAGDGATTFNLPDLRGDFIRGWDDGRGVDAGRAFGTGQGSQNLSHNHSASTDAQGAHSHSYTYMAVTSGSPPNYINGGTAITPFDFVSGATSVIGAHGHNVSVGFSGGTEARPRNIALLACIKF